jgi:Protein of unknown function (DUF3147)
MLIQVDWSIIRTTKWHDYASRFALGGLITVAAGLIAKEWGPVVGGLFLAFPAIFPATATLAEKREIEKKSKSGLAGVKRGRKAAASEAAGAVIGSVGLFAFALVFWKLLPSLRLWLVFLIALIAWSGVSVALWFARRRLRFRRKHATHLEGRGLVP